MHYLVKQFVPPILKTIRWFSFKYGWKGNYKSYAEAQKNTTGYSAAHILERIVATTTKVKNKEVAYERDGRIYSKAPTNFPMLSGLLWMASTNNNNLTVLDFGGSLGTTYFQKLPYLHHLSSINWCIVEQPNYVEAGKKHFESEQLHFYFSIEECMQHQQPQIAMFCGVLQYLENYKAVIEKLVHQKIPYLLLDYIAFTEQATDRFTVQNVPPEFYGIEASYACIFFNKQNFYAFLEQYYELVFDYTADNDHYYVELESFKYQGCLWKLKA